MLALSACVPDSKLAPGSLSAGDFVAPSVVAAPDDEIEEAPATEPASTDEPPLRTTTEVIEPVEPDRSPVAQPITPPLSDEVTPGPRPRSVDAAPAPRAERPQPRLLVLAAEPNLDPEAEVNPAAPPAVVGALVGQINGRPIYAEEVLDPIAARLRAAAREVREGRETREAFYGEAQDAIGRRLAQIVSEELFLSEAETKIPDEQRLQALDYYRQLVREQIVAEQGQGSVEAAERWARKEHQQTLQEHVDTVLRNALIQQQLRQEVRSRVQVSWHEIKTAYREQYERFHPQPFARVRVLVLAAAAEQKRRQVEAALESGRELAELIELGEVEPLLFNERQGLFRATLPEASLETLSLFEEPVYRPLGEAARDLEPGETSAPIVFNEGRLVGWVALEALESPPPVSLYEAQRDLRDEIMQAKTFRERERFQNSFLTPADSENIRVMAEMIFNIAVREYLPR